MFRASSAARYVPDLEYGRHGQIVLSNGMAIKIWSKEHGLSQVGILKREEELTEEAIFWLQEEIGSSKLFGTTQEYLSWVLSDDPTLIVPISEGLNMSDIEVVQDALLLRPYSRFDWSLE